VIGERVPLWLFPFAGKTMKKVETDSLQELVVVGAGPHSLALLCRLFEASPFGILNNQEHQRLHHLRNKSRQASKDSILFSCGEHIDIDKAKRKVKVIDSSGGWMNHWNSCFESLNIDYLRSPIYFHPDPFDPESLRAFAELQNRKSELRDITHVISSGTKRKSKKG
jgi:hypothetical protein